MAVKKERGGVSLAAAIREAYCEGASDYYMEPLVAADEHGRPVGKVEDGDTVIFCCRRGEREIELTEMFTDSAFAVVQREQRENLHFVLFTLYHEKFAGMPVAFGPEKLTDTLAQALSEAGKTQLHCAESEKYAHVTFFFNGGNNAPYPEERDICIPSPRGVAFESVPQLSLPEVTDTVIGELGKYDFAVVNFANGDVIGHTADNVAKLEAAKCVSESLDRLVKAAVEKNYVVMITADHGNLERMTTPKGKPDVAHTCNPVPFVLIDPKGETVELKTDKALSSVAPTVLEWMGVRKPEKMTAESLTACPPKEKKRKVLLVILDGWGVGAQDATNPIHIGETEPWKTLFASYPHTLLHASGEWVGLEKGKAGNSEAGHSNLGAGRMVPQDDQRLATAMEDGSFECNPVFLEAIERTKREKKALHLLAYLTKMSSHGSIVYAQKLAAMAKDLDRIYLHLILDGRSTEPGSAPELVLELEEELQKIGTGMIVDCVGRGIVLDRDHDYEKVKRGYDAMVLGEGKRYLLADD